MSRGRGGLVNVPGIEPEVPDTVEAYHGPRVFGDVIGPLPQAVFLNVPQIFVVSHSISSLWGCSLFGRKINGNLIDN